MSLKITELQSFLRIIRLTKAVQVKHIIQEPEGPYIKTRIRHKIKDTNSPREYEQHFNFVKNVLLQLLYHEQKMLTGMPQNNFEEIVKYV